MKGLVGMAMAIGIVGFSAAASKPLASVPKFDGKFVWIKLGNLPAMTAKTLNKAKTISVALTFRKDVHLKKDKSGNQWFTFILSDQGSDWAWHQTTGAGGVPVQNGVVKAGTYTISIPTAGIPAKILADKMQTVSLGPAASGLAAPASFTINSVKGK